MDGTRSPGDVWLLARHYVEMLVAMGVGMVTLFPAWVAASGQLDARWLARTEVEALAMATAMAVPMAVWMVVRGHGTGATAEMCAAMYAGFVALFPLLWWDVVDRSALLGLAHVAMLLLMALVVVRRSHEYAHRP